MSYYYTCTLYNFIYGIPILEWVLIPSPEVTDVVGPLVSGGVDSITGSDGCGGVTSGGADKVYFM